LSGRLKSLENPAVLGGEGAAATGFAEVSFCENALRPTPSSVQKHYRCLRAARRFERCGRLQAANGWRSHEELANPRQFDLMDGETKWPGRCFMVGTGAADLAFKAVATGNK